jgi:cytoskeletal protein RodZ
MVPFILLFVALAVMVVLTLGLIRWYGIRKEGARHGRPSKKDEDEKEEDESSQDDDEEEGEDGKEEEEVEEEDEEDGEEKDGKEGPDFVELED